MGEILPLLNLPAPLDINFDLELSQSAETKDVDVRSLGTTAQCNTSPAPLTSLEYFQFPTLTVNSHEQNPVAVPPLRKINRERLTNTNQMSNTPPPPSKPLEWIWICHLCHSRYAIGATRRCLVDGHYYCSGESATTLQRNVKRRKQGISCSSEFDYIGWKAWGIWRRGVLSSRRQHQEGLMMTKGRKNDNMHGLRGCENCEYPSECRYESMARTATSPGSTSLSGGSDDSANQPGTAQEDQEDENVEATESHEACEDTLNQANSTATGRSSLETIPEQICDNTNVTSNGECHSRQECLCSTSTAISISSDSSSQQTKGMLINNERTKSELVITLASQSSVPSIVVSRDIQTDLDESDLSSGLAKLPPPKTGRFKEEFDINRTPYEPLIINHASKPSSDNAAYLPNPLKSPKKETKRYYSLINDLDLSRSNTRTPASHSSDQNHTTLSPNRATFKYEREPTQYNNNNSGSQKTQTKSESSRRSSKDRTAYTSSPSSSATTPAQNLFDEIFGMIK